MPKNPFAGSDGSPKIGKELQFFDWEVAQKKEQVDKLTPAQKEKVLKAEKSIAKKMQS